MTVPSTPIVVITVEDGTPVAKPDPVDVDDVNTLLVFYIDTKGYAFPPSGAIVITRPADQQPADRQPTDPTDGDIDENFPFPAWSTSASSVALFDSRASCGKTFKYSINLIDLQTGLPVTHDPSIRNGHIGDPKGGRRTGR